MFSPMEFEEQEFRIKPMNCPFHIAFTNPDNALIASYRFVMPSWALSIAPNCRNAPRFDSRSWFTQDDAHIFCTPEMVRGEIIGCIDFAFHMFEVFGFKDIKVELSVRGTDGSVSYLGSDEDWTNAEEALTSVLNDRGIAYERVEGEQFSMGQRSIFALKTQSAATGS